ncbi:MAG: hypothetical protein ACHQX3_02590, partial [Nitrospirales bacterium]
MLLKNNSGTQGNIGCRRSRTVHALSAGSSKRPSSKAAASEGPEAYPLGYVEDLKDARTTLADFFSVLLGR